MDARIIEIHYKEVFQYTYFLVGKRARYIREGVKK